jgi:hypothetical protein
MCWSLARCSIMRCTSVLLVCSCCCKIDRLAGGIDADGKLRRLWTVCVSCIPCCVDRLWVRRSYDLFDVHVGVSENEDSAACCNSDRRFRWAIAPWPCQQEFAKMSRAIYEYLDEIDFRLLHGTRSGVELHYRAMPLSRNLGSPMYRASDQLAVYMQSRILLLEKLRTPQNDPTWKFPFNFSGLFGRGLYFLEELSSDVKSGAIAARA